MIVFNISSFSFCISYNKQALIFLFFIRDELKRHYTLGEYWVEVEMEDLASFDEDLSDCLYKLPTENLTLVSVNSGSRQFNWRWLQLPLLCSRSHGFVFLQLEEAAKEVADEVTRPRPVGEETVQDIQVMLKSDAHHASIRSLKVLLHPLCLIFFFSKSSCLFD